MATDEQHLRHCILFTFQLKKNAAEATNMICSALGENAVTYKTIEKWYQKFQSGDFSLADKERSGTPKKFKSKNLELLQLLEFLSPTSKCHDHELALQLGVTCRPISARLNKGKILKLGQKIQHKLSPGRKQKRLSSLTRKTADRRLHGTHPGREGGSRTLQEVRTSRQKRA